MCFSEELEWTKALCSVRPCVGQEEMWDKKATHLHAPPVASRCGKMESKNVPAGQEMVGSSTRGCPRQKVPFFRSLLLRPWKEFLLCSCRQLGWSIKNGN